MINRILSASRFLTLIAVVCIGIAATTLMVYGGLETWKVVLHTVEEGEITSKGAKSLILSCIEIVDLFLLGTVLYITSIGLYELFISDI